MEEINKTKPQIENEKFKTSDIKMEKSGINELEKGIEEENVCNLNDCFIILVNESKYFFIRNIKEKIRFKNKLIPLQSLIGKKYGSIFELVAGELKLLDKKPCFDDLLNEKDFNEEGDVIGDNREIQDGNDAQELSSDQIQQMKKNGATGEQIIREVIKNSKSWKKKAIFSQQKYIKKKIEKHLIIINLIKSSPSNLINAFFSQSPHKVANLRNDSLAYLLTIANLKANSKLLTIDESNGVLLGSILYRTNNCASILNLHFDKFCPKYPAVNLFNVSFKTQISHQSLSSFEKNEEKYDALILVLNPSQNNFYPIDPFIQLYQKNLKEGRVFVAFCAFLEPMTLLLNYLQKNSINYNLVEFWTRPFQVLEGRTHPEMRMDGASGYILYATKIQSQTQEKIVENSPQIQQNIENLKKRKIDEEGKEEEN